MSIIYTLAGIVAPYGPIRTRPAFIVVVRPRIGFGILYKFFLPLAQDELVVFRIILGKSFDIRFRHLRTVPLCARQRIETDETHSEDLRHIESIGWHGRGP